jgi:hypothetical protein
MSATATVLQHILELRGSLIIKLWLIHMPRMEKKASRCAYFLRIYYTSSRKQSGTDGGYHGPTLENQHAAKYYTELGRIS